MKNKILVSAMLAGAITFGAGAATESFTYSYCDQPCNLSGFGYNSMAQKYGAAMLFNEPAYSGMKVVKIDAYLNLDESSYSNISDTQVFLSTVLPLDSDQATVISDVAPAPGTWKNFNKYGQAVDETVTVLSYELESPYVLGDSPLYIGYFLNVDNVVGPGERYPILLDKDVQDNPASFLYFDEYATQGQWTDNNYTSGAAIIVLTIEREVKDYSITISNIDKAYAEVNKDFNVLVQLANTGLNPIDKITYEYSIDGANAETATLELESPLAPSISQIYDVLFPMSALDNTGEYAVDLTISQVNGQENESDASAYFALEVFPYFPQHRPLIEEFTSILCGNCPRGYVMMEYLAEEYPDDLVLICYHNKFQGNDPMTVTNEMPVFTNSNPTASIDRLGIVDPYYGDYEKYGLRDMGMVTDAFRRAAVPSIVDISIPTLTVNPTDSIITFSTEVNFMKAVDNDAYRLAYVLTCNGLNNPLWGQDNFYSGDNSILDTPLISECYYWPKKKYGLTFNDVAINVEAYHGLRNSIVNVIPGTPFTTEYSFDVRDVRNVDGRSLNPYLYIHRMVVNAFVIERATGQVINACKFPVRSVYNGVEGIEADLEVPVVEYYDLNGVRVENPGRGIFVKITNGKAEKIVK